jgi:predicted permease
MLGSTSSSSYDVGDQETVDGQDALNHHITPGYFKTMGIPVLRGRDLEPGESGAVLVNEAFARRHWPNGNPLDGRVSLDRQEEPFLPVVGVVGNVRHAGLAQEPVPEMYFPIAGYATRGYTITSFQVMLRTVPDPRTLIPVLKQTLRELDPDLPLGNPRTMEAVLVRDRQDAQARSILLGAFAGLALLLAGVGIYAVITFLTALRTREIGVRMAMGAQVRDVLKLVVGQGLRMALSGVAAGVAISLLMARLLDTQIAGVRSWDPFTFASVAGLLALVGIVACLLPALRAARVDPMIALRNE